MRWPGTRRGWPPRSRCCSRSPTRGGELTLEQVWESIEAVVPRGELRESVDAVAGMVPPPGSDADAEMRAQLTERIATVTPFLKILTEVIEFGAAPRRASRRSRR